MQVNYLKQSMMSVQHNANSIVNSTKDYTNEHVLNPKTVIIPYWIDRHIKQSNINHSDIYNYDVMRKHFALDDLIDLYSSYVIIASIGKKINNYSVMNDCWCASLNEGIFIKSDSLLKEYMASVNPLLCSDAVLTRVKDRLESPTGLSNILNNNYEETFSIKLLSSRVIVIIMKEGFINTISHPEGIKFFLVQYLKALYSFINIHKVSKYPAFKEYVSCLQVLQPN